MAVINRPIVRIDEEKCDGCALCIPSCAEGAIQIIDGKAKLIADNLCDGFGNCLGTCPQDAIIVEERSAEEFDEVAVESHLEELGERAAPVESERHEHRQELAHAGPPPQGHGVGLGGRHGGHAHGGHGLPMAQGSHAGPGPGGGGCPGSMLRQLQTDIAEAPAPGADTGPRPSRLRQWPVQLTLLPPVGRIWEEADVLIAADCVPVTVPDFHDSMLDGKTLAIACPKLDNVEPYVQKLAMVFANNSIKSITVAKMEVPCCTGIATVALAALEQARVDIPVKVITIGIQGNVLHESIESPRLAV